MRSLRPVWVELAGEKHRKRQDLVRPSQVRDLPAQLLDLLALLLLGISHSWHNGRLSFPADEIADQSLRKTSLAQLRGGRMALDGAE
jgi:hypothetical protein